MYLSKMGQTSYHSVRVLVLSLTALLVVMRSVRLRGAIFACYTLTDKQNANRTFVSAVVYIGRYQATFHITLREADFIY